MTMHTTFTLTIGIRTGVAMPYEGFIRDNGEVYIVKALAEKSLTKQAAQTLAKNSADIYGATFIETLDRNLVLTQSSLEVHQSIVRSYEGDIAEMEAEEEYRNHVRMNGIMKQAREEDMMRDGGPAI